MNVKQLPDQNLNWPIDYESVCFIASEESSTGARLKAYLCPAGVPTIGWGTTRGVKLGMVCTKAQADEWLLQDLTEFTAQVRGVCKVEPTNNQLSAMVSLAYNIGFGAFRDKSTVLKAHNRGDFAAAARAFTLWNKARVNGVLQELPGLVSRRLKESALYMEPDDDIPQIPMPQAVEPESSPIKSPISQAGATTAVAGLLTSATALGELAEPVSKQISSLSSTFGVDPKVGLAVLLLAAGVSAIYWRWRQREGGWA